MFRSRKALASMASAALLAASLAACGSDSSSDGAKETPGDSASAAAQALVEKARTEITWPKAEALDKPADLTGKTVWWIPIGDGVPALNATGAAFKEAIGAAGGSVKLCDGKFNPSDIGNCLKSAVAQKADAVVTYYIDYAMIPNAFDALVKEEIPLLVGAAQPAREDTQTLAFWDTADVTRALNEYVAAGSLVEAGANPNGIAILLTDTPTTEAATQAMVDKWTELCPDCDLATVKHSSANQDKLPSLISAELVKNPKANVILSPDDSLVASISQALKTAGRTDVKVVSSSGALANMQQVKSGSQAADVGQPTAFVGWNVANALFQLLGGQKVTPPPVAIRYFDKSNVESLKLDGATYATSDWYGDDSYMADFKTAWGLK